ncbi:MAG: CpaF family protein [Alphaproteobacteria bacterium]|nr:CpaF family protein [Alphaproteobacteria bacterium]
MVKDVFAQDLGVIKPLIEDESVNDILINRHDRIFVERKGKLEMSELAYADENAVRDVAQKIVSGIGRSLDPKRPLVDARLLDGSRVNIIAPPLAVDGTSISIRKFSKRKITLDVMKEQQNLSEPLAELLKILGHCRINMLISGGTGSGKTTLLNAISQYIEHSERVVTIEDAAELQLQQPHVVRLETKPISSGVSAAEEVTMRDLVKNALRMRPDRIIVGEVRGPEAFDMMQAMNTGHDGSLTTIHANHPRDALARLENMISMANLNIPTRSVRQQIASALQVIVQISRMRDGKRRITYVSEIVGVEGDTITMQDLFQFTAEREDEAGNLSGTFKWSGILPRFLRRIIYYGEGEHLSQALGVKLPKL